TPPGTWAGCSSGSAATGTWWWRRSSDATRRSPTGGRSRGRPGTSSRTGRRGASAALPAGDASAGATRGSWGPGQDAGGGGGGRGGVRGAEGELGFEEVAARCKREVLDLLFAGEGRTLAAQLHSIAVEDRHGRDLTEDELRAALVEVMAWLPAYRTYTTGPEV